MLAQSKKKKKAARNSQTFSQWLTLRLKTSPKRKGERISSPMTTSHLQLKMLQADNSRPSPRNIHPSPSRCHHQNSNSICLHLSSNSRCHPQNNSSRCPHPHRHSPSPASRRLMPLSCLLVIPSRSSKIKRRYSMKSNQSPSKTYPTSSVQ